MTVLVPGPDLWPREAESCSGRSFERCGMKWLREKMNTIVDATNRVDHGTLMNFVYVGKEMEKYAVCTCETDRVHEGLANKTYSS